MYMVFVNGIFYEEFSLKYYAEKYIKDVIIRKFGYCFDEDNIKIVKDGF